MSPWILPQGGLVAQDPSCTLTFYQELESDESFRKMMGYQLMMSLMTAAEADDATQHALGAL